MVESRSERRNLQCTLMCGGALMQLYLNRDHKPFHSQLLSCNL